MVSGGLNVLSGFRWSTLRSFMRTLTRQPPLLHTHRTPIQLECSTLQGSSEKPDAFIRPWSHRACTSGAAMARVDVGQTTGFPAAVSRPTTVARTPQYQVGKRRGTFDCLKPKRPFERGTRITRHILRALRRHD